MVALFCIALAGLFSAVMDTLQFNYDSSVFRFLPYRWWNPAVSYRNKYQSDGKTPRFKYSTSLLVWVTDAWHLFQFLHYKAIILSIVFYTRLTWYPLDFVILHFVFTGTKELFFGTIFRKKHGNAA